MGELCLGCVLLITAILRRRVDPFGALLSSWGIVFSLRSLQLVCLEPLALGTATVVVVSVVSFGIGNYIGGRVFGRGNITVRPDVVSHILTRYYCQISLLSLGKSLVFLYRQYGKMSLVGLTAIRELTRMRWEQYLVYSTFLDFMLSALGGAFWRKSEKRLIVTVVPLLNTLLISVAMGGRTYFFWSVICWLYGMLAAPRTSHSNRVRSPASLIPLGVPVLVASESIRYLRGSFQPYQWNMEMLRPFIHPGIQPSNLLIQFLVVSYHYWMAPVSAFQAYVAQLRWQDIRFLGWFLRGIVDVYGMSPLRPFVDVPVHTNVYTWLPYFYEDLGWTGFFLYPLLLGIISGRQYRLFTASGSPGSLCAVAVLACTALFSPFDYCLNNRAVYWALIVSIICSEASAYVRKEKRGVERGDALYG